MNPSRKNTTILISIILFLFLPYSLYAQTANTQGPTIEEFKQQLQQELFSFKKKYVQLETFPQYPEPHQKIEVNLNSSYFDLNRARIFWYVNGSLYKSGTGVKKIEVTSGSTGESTRIRAIADVIRDGKTERIEKYTEIMPIEMTLLWQADTYTPPFYKGKALLSANSVLKVIAIPNIQLKNGKRIDANKLIYIWKGEGRNKLFNDNSGYGKNVLYTEGSLPYRNNIVRVEVSSLDDTIKSSKRIELEISEPSILFYKENPIKGVIYEEAIKDKFYLMEQELPLKIEPYFFSRKDKDVGNLIYEWYVNNKKIDNSSRKATFRREDRLNRGISRIKIKIKNTYRQFQQAESSFILDFNNSGSLN